MLYSVAPAGIFATSPIRSPERLAGVPISVGYQSASHYATIQGLEQYLPLDRINLSFPRTCCSPGSTVCLMGPQRHQRFLVDYLAQQLGFRKVLDVTFMIATMVTGNPVPEDLDKYFAALRRAQRELIASTEFRAN